MIAEVVTPGSFLISSGNVIGSKGAIGADDVAFLVHFEANCDVTFF
jgi:hypothetical protein